MNSIRRKENLTMSIVQEVNAIGGIGELIKYIAKNTDNNVELLVRTNYVKTTIPDDETNNYEWFVHLTRWSTEFSKDLETIYKTYTNDLLWALRHIAKMIIMKEI